MIDRGPHFPYLDSSDLKKFGNSAQCSNAMSTFTVSSLYQWPRHCTPKAREIVLNIINSAKTPMATKDIYNLAVKPARASTPAPHAGEEIRSMRQVCFVRRECRKTHLYPETGI